jgi:hypothetical protein
MSKKITSVAVAIVGVLALAAPAFASTTGNQRFRVIIRQTPDSATCMAVATGVITGVGTCTLVQGPDVTDVHIVLPDGTLDVHVVVTNSVEDFNAQACVYRFTDTETYTITGGSGASEGATGGGTDTTRGVLTFPHADNGCDQSQPRGVIIAVGSGTASV